jgi:hypothetical protein
MAFLFPRNPRKSIYGGKYTKDHHSSFVFPATCSPRFVITTRSPSFVIATRSLSFVIATRSPSFVIATMRTSHPTGYSIHYHERLNRFMVDYDIVRILKNYVGYSSWDDVPLKLKDLCYKNYNSKMPLPSWNGDEERYSA